MQIPQLSQHFTGEKFVVITKSEICNAVDLGFIIFNDYAENTAQLINNIDRLAAQFGYEFNSFTNQAVILKKITGK